MGIYIFFHHRLTFIQLHCHYVNDLIISIHLLLSKRQVRMPIIIKYNPINQITLTKTAK